MTRHVRRQGRLLRPGHARPRRIDAAAGRRHPGASAPCSAARPSSCGSPLAHGRACSRCSCSTIASASGCGRSARTPWRRAASGCGSGASSTRAVLGSGALCGLAGAQLSLGIVTQFVEGMTFGRGFIALVAVMFGRAHPIGVLGASLFFGGAYALAAAPPGPGHPVPVREHAAVPRHHPGARGGLRPCRQPAAGPPGHRRGPPEVEVAT